MLTAFVNGFLDTQLTVSDKIFVFDINFFEISDKKLKYSVVVLPENKLLQLRSLYNNESYLRKIYRAYDYLVTPEINLRYIYELSFFKYL